MYRLIPKAALVFCLSTDQEPEAQRQWGQGWSENNQPNSYEIQTLLEWLSSLILDNFSQLREESMILKLNGTRDGPSVPKPFALDTDTGWWDRVLKSRGKGGGFSGFSTFFPFPALENWSY